MKGMCDETEAHSPQMHLLSLKLNFSMRNAKN